MVNATFICQFTRGCKLGGTVAFTIFVPMIYPSVTHFNKMNTKFNGQGVEMRLKVLNVAKR